MGSWRASRHVSLVAKIGFYRLHGPAARPEHRLQTFDPRTCCHLRRRHGSKGLGAGSLARTNRRRRKEHGRVRLWHSISINIKGATGRPSYHKERHGCGGISIGGRLEQRSMRLTRHADLEVSGRGRRPLLLGRLSQPSLDGEDDRYPAVRQSCNVAPGQDSRRLTSRSSYAEPFRVSHGPLGGLAAGRVIGALRTCCA